VGTLIDALQRLDTGLMRLLNLAPQNPAFDFIMPLFDKSLYWMAPIALAVIGVLIFGGKRGAWAALGAVVVVVMTDQIGASLLKPWISRIRPCNVLAGLHVWWSGGWIYLPDPVLEIYKASYSFPSNHATNAGGQAIWWGAVYPKWRWGAWSFTALIGYSRIYIGVHWPADVVGGWIIGAGVALGVFWAARIWGPKVLSRLQRLSENA